MEMDPNIYNFIKVLTNNHKKYNLTILQYAVPKTLTNVIKERF